MTDKDLETWDLWIPKTAAVGISFGRSRIRRSEILLVHAAPAMLTIEVYDENGQKVAEGKDLETTADTPIARISRRGDRLEREDIWPQKQDLGLLVLLPGGEAGELKTWWNAEDHSEWRWQVEFYNNTA